jgi:hypothetical protein
MKPVIFVLLFFLLTLSDVALADQDSHGVSIDEVLADIAVEQNVATTKEIECEIISDEQLEKLGEAVMSLRHPDPEEHEIMDEMMGGESSDSLKTMHANMGKGYLDCGGGSGMMSGMMNGSTLHKGSSGNQMMSNFGLGAFNYITLILLWLALILVIASAVKYLFSKK